MERRHFLKVALGIAAGTAVFAATTNAAPLSPVSPVQGLAPSRGETAEPAVVSQNEVDHLKPEEVHWHHHGHWHRRHWGWHHRHWHRRHWR